jgi:hypothetical protein
MAPYIPTDYIASYCAKTTISSLLFIFGGRPTGAPYQFIFFDDVAGDGDA